MHEHVALIFPGRRYGAEMPLLHYPAQGLLQLGAGVHVVDYPQFLVEAETPTDEQWREASGVIGAAVADRVEGASRVTLLAKSLGTRVIARLSPEGLPGDVAAAWFTPVFVESATAVAAAAKPWRSLYVHGSADPSCDEVVLAEVVVATGGAVLRIDGGDHALEVAGDVEASLDALVRVTRAVVTLAATTGRSA
jgi:hypothetical protein